MRDLTRDIGMYCRKWRKSMGDYSQRKIAEEANCTQSYISDFERKGDNCTVNLYMTYRRLGMPEFPIAEVEHEAEG